MCADNIAIVDITEGEMVRAVAKLHVEAFNGYLNARFGMGYTTSFINWFVHSKEALALAAIDHQQRTMGYVLGVPTEHGHRPYRDLQAMALRSLVLRPWLFFDARLWQAAKSRFKPLVNRERTRHRHELPEPVMGLVSIGVGSSYRRQKVAAYLMEAFQEKARIRKMRSLSAWVYQDNTSARRLYEKCGWQPYMESLNERGSLKYFKVIGE